METVRDFILGGLQNHCKWWLQHKIKIHLLLIRKAMVNFDSILKSWDITLPRKVHLVKTMIFPVVMYRCESWTIKKPECQRLDAFELCVMLEKTLESSLDCKEIKPVHPKGNQSWIFIGRTDAEAEAPILWPPSGGKELTPWKRPWCWERLKAEGEGDDRGWEGWRASPTQWTIVWVNSGVGDGQGGLACCSPWGPKESDTTKQLKCTELFWNSIDLASAEIS